MLRMSDIPGNLSTLRKKIRGKRLPWNLFIVTNEKI